MLIKNDKWEELFNLGIRQPEQLLVFVDALREKTHQIGFDTKQEDNKEK